MSLNVEKIQDILGGILLCVIIIIICVLMSGCTPPDPNRTDSPITVQDIYGVCWKIEPAHIYGDTHYGSTVKFLKVGCF